MCCQVLMLQERPSAGPSVLKLGLSAGEASTYFVDHPLTQIQKQDPSVLMP